MDRNKTIFFPGDPAERVYLIRRGAVRLSRVYESGEEITVALLRENSLFGVLSLLTGQRSDRFYHAVAFTRVEMVTAPATSVKAAIEADTSVGLRLLQGIGSSVVCSSSSLAGGWFSPCPNTMGGVNPLVECDLAATFKVLPGRPDRCFRDDHKPRRPPILPKFPGSGSAGLATGGLEALACRL